MPPNITLYHNPQCSKSRRALELLSENAERVTVVEYLKQPPTAGELRSLITSLGLRAHGIVRTKEPEYKQARLSPASDDDEVIAAIVRYPRLLERPIAVCGSKAVIARPPEKVLGIL